MSKVDFLGSGKEQKAETREILNPREKIRQSLIILKEKHRKNKNQEGFRADNDLIGLPIEDLSDEELDLWQEVVAADSKEKMDAVLVKYQNYKKNLFNAKNPPGIKDSRGIFNSLVGNYLSVLNIYFRLKKSSEEIEKFRRNYQN